MVCAADQNLESWQKGFRPVGTQDGQYHLNEYQTLQYVRIRKLAGNDFKRTERQRIAISTLLEKAKGLNFFQLLNMVNQTVDHVVSNMNENELLQYAIRAGKYARYTIHSDGRLPLDGENTNRPLLLGGGKPVWMTDPSHAVRVLHEWIYTLKRGYCSCHPRRHRCSTVEKDDLFGQRRRKSVCFSADGMSSFSPGILKTEDHRERRNAYAASGKRTKLSKRALEERGGSRVDLSGGAYCLAGYGMGRIFMGCGWPPAGDSCAGLAKPRLVGADCCGLWSGAGGFFAALSAVCGEKRLLLGTGSAAAPGAAEHLHLLDSTGGGAAERPPIGKFSGNTGI